MEAKSRKKLDDLPPNDDSFWDKADVLVHKIKTNKCEHEFIRNSGYSVECKKCHAGYFIGPGYTIKEGHIYNSGQFLV